jgi:membrane protein
MIRWLKERVWPLVTRTLREWSGDDGGLLAASLAFYTAFSFFPLLLVLLSIAGFVLRLSPQAQQVQRELIDAVALHASPEIAERLAEVMTQIRTAAPVGGPLGLATLLFGAIGIFANMEVAFARIWKTRDLPSEHGGWLHTIWQVLFVRLKAFVVVLILGLFVAATFFAGFALAALRRFVGAFSGYVGETAEQLLLNDRLWNVIQLGTGYLLNVVLFTTTYRLFSLRKTSWLECLQGGLLAGVFWEVGRYLLTLYLLRGGYDAYGVIGSFIAMMLWFYYAWTVLFFGAEFVQVTHRMRAARQAAHAVTSRTTKKS